MQRPQRKWFCGTMIICMLACRHLPALGESLATLVGAMPVAFLEPDLNAHNPLSVFNTKNPRERASSYLPDGPVNFKQPIDLLWTLLFRFLQIAKCSCCLCVFLSSSSQYARLSGRDVSWDAPPWQAPQRCQRCLWVRCSLQRHAPGLSSWFAISMCTNSPSQHTAPVIPSPVFSSVLLRPC